MVACGRANVEDIMRRWALIIVVARHADGALCGPLMGVVMCWMRHEARELVREVHARSAVAILVVVRRGELSERFWDREIRGRRDEEAAGIERVAAVGGRVVWDGGGSAVRGGSRGCGGREVEALLAGEDLWLVGRVECGCHRVMCRVGRGGQ